MTNKPVGAKQGAAAAQWPGGSEAILLVEDDVVLRDLFCAVLGTCGYEVSIAASGSEALAAVHRRAGRFALVVSDVRMPGMSGLELARRLRAEGESAPILLLSGYGEADLAGVAGLAVTFAEKPLPPGVLARKVRELLDG
ncbi:MAG TPA: response regulator [Thermoanaerobaculia bacterium]|jgi:CheY-like chemotaxis protein|nr:response regulator [Thermoanaerobaculia bacterium]